MGEKAEFTGGVNDDFEVKFNAATANKIVFQQPARLIQRYACTSKEKALISRDEQKRLEAKIAAVEMMTSAEFKIIICGHAWFGLKRKAKQLFKKYGLDKTEQRNAVLVLIAEKDHEFLIYGDEGIHQIVGDGYWLNVRNQMLEYFKQGDISGGLAMGLHMLADIMAEHFPKTDDDNELCNKIIFEK